MNRDLYKQQRKERLESAIQRGYEMVGQFSELGRAGDRVVRELNQDIQKAEKILRRFDDYHTIEVEAAIKRLKP